MSEATLTFAGVILGAAIAGGVSLWQVQLVAKRGREELQALREQERKDRSDAFQVEAIVALQDAIADVNRAVERERRRRLEEHHWPVEQGGKPFEYQGEEPLEYLEARWAIARFRSRVFDPVLREKADAFRNTAREVIRAPNAEVMRKKAEEQIDRGREVNERITQLLPRLF